MNVVMYVVKEILPVELTKAHVQNVTLDFALGFTPVLCLSNKLKDKCS